MTCQFEYASTGIIVQVHKSSTVFVSCLNKSLKWSGTKISPVGGAGEAPIKA